MDLLLHLAACVGTARVGPLPETTVPTTEAPSDAALFDPDHVVEVAITLDPDDWEALRNQTRTYFDLVAGDCMAQPFDSPYTWFEGAMTIDGEHLDDVGLKKKGFIGSLSTTKPGLKIDFDEYVDGRAFHGLDRFTLNNVPQDPTLLRTCLAYEVFAAAGVPASRCNFAHVVVNDEDLGIYAHVETVDEDFLDRTLGRHDVPLFEGTASDLRAGWLDTFDPDSDVADTADLVPAQQAVDAQDLDAIAATVDLDAFYTFWAAEVLLGQWDGYTWGTNNFYVYLDPADARVRFVPWGPDAALSTANPGGGVDWIAAGAALPWVLARTEEGDAAYRARAEALLDTAWDEDALLAEVDRMHDLLAPWYTSTPTDLRALKSILKGRDDAMRDGLAGASPDWPDALRGIPCMVDVGDWSVDFDTTWDSYDTEDWRTYGAADLAITVDGEAWDLAPGTAVAGDVGGDQAGVLPVAAWGDTLLAPYLQLPQDRVRPGTEEIDWNDVYALLYYADASTGGEFVQGAWLSGELTFASAGTGPGDVVRGRAEGTVWGGG